MTNYLLRIGNGNDGNYPHARIEIGKNDCPYAFMDVVIANLFVPGHKARSHAYQNVDVDGEAEFTIYATLHESFRGEQNMGAAYRTAELSPITDAFYDDLPIYTISEFLDRGALMKYNQKRSVA